MKKVLIYLGLFGVGFLVGVGGAYLGQRLNGEEVLRFSGGTNTARSAQDDEVALDSLVTSSSTAGGEENSKQVIKIVAVGDVMLSRTVHNQMVKKGDYSWPFLETAERLRSADLTIGNLETPLLESCPAMTNRMVFCAEDESLEGLMFAGFDVWSLANNHIFNQGKLGLAETERILSEGGMAGVVEGEMEIEMVLGKRIGIVAFDDVSRQLEMEAVRVLVASAAAEVDVTVVMMHWGVEYVATPTARQIDLGHMLVDVGVDIVIGSHPHWVQPVEEYSGGLIFWSLGNFVFDQMWSEETRKGAIAEISVFMSEDGKRNFEYEMVPVKIFEYGQPRIVVSE